MKLRDRFRRWWSPAQWADDHPLEGKERPERKRHPARSAIARHNEALGSEGLANVERDFKKPRP